MTLLSEIAGRSLRLPRALAAARTRPQVTVTYGGDADIRAATAAKRLAARAAHSPNGR